MKDAKKVKKNITVVSTVNKVGAGYEACKSCPNVKSCSSCVENAIKRYSKVKKADAILALVEEAQINANQIAWDARREYKLKDEVKEAERLKTFYKNSAQAKDKTISVYNETKGVLMDNLKKAKKLNDSLTKQVADKDDAIAKLQFDLRREKESHQSDNSRNEYRFKEEVEARALDVDRFETINVLIGNVFKIGEDVDKRPAQYSLDNVLHEIQQKSNALESIDDMEEVYRLKLKFDTCIEFLEDLRETAEILNADIVMTGRPSRRIN